jgi:hypothetical protein
MANTTGWCSTVTSVHRSTRRTQSAHETHQRCERAWRFFFRKFFSRPFAACPPWRVIRGLSLRHSDFACHAVGRRGDRRRVVFCFPQISPATAGFVSTCSPCPPRRGENFRSSRLDSSEVGKIFENFVPQIPEKEVKGYLRGLNNKPPFRTIRAIRGCLP